MVHSTPFFSLAHARAPCKSHQLRNSSAPPRRSFSALGFPMAAAVRVPHGRPVSLAVLAAFVHGALWLASALYISRTVERCLAVEGSVWRDKECFFNIRWTATVTVVALMFVAALSYGEAARHHEQMVTHPQRYLSPPSDVL